MPKPFCSTCLSDFFLWHRPGCEAWVFPIVWPAPDPSGEGPVNSNQEDLNLRWLYSTS